MVKFNATKEEMAFVDKIVTRAIALAKELGRTFDKVDLVMDITACHCNGCPLDLEKLMRFDDGDLGHDVFGINKHINRDTGKLMDCFLPRCAKGELNEDEG